MEDKKYEVVPIADIQTMASAITRSGLFGMKTIDQAIALMLIAQAEGMHPAIAARDYHIIQGRPTLKADAMLARFQAAGGSVKWKEMSDKTVSAVFSHPQGGSIEIDWDIARAEKAELGKKDMWKKYPRQMLRARVISEGIRTVFPGVSVGMCTPEEVQDFSEAEVVKVDREEPAEAEKPQAQEHGAKQQDPSAQHDQPITKRFKCKTTNKFAPAYCPHCQHKSNCPESAPEGDNPQADAEIIDYTFFVQQIDKLDSAAAVLKWGDANLSKAGEMLQADEYEKLKSYISQMVDIFNK